MKTIKLLFLVLFFPILLFSQTNLTFDDYFLDKTMRIDYYHIGDAREEFVTVDQIYQQGIWAGNPEKLIDPFNNGKYEIKVYDVASNRLIYSRGFASYFGEYTTTNPALDGIKRTYHESALIPYPQNSILFVMEKRNQENILQPLFQYRIDPNDYHIIKLDKNPVDKIYEALNNGNPHEKVDLAWIAEGYTAKEFDKFKKDVDRFMKALFEVEPFKKLKKEFNIYGVFRPSVESGVDQPREDIYKNTVVNSSFNALDLDRYLLTEDNKSLRDIAASVPHDGVVIMVNSERYGGGGIYNFYAVSTVDNEWSENVFTHEFGHSFGGLADEYYSSQVAYNDFYPKGVEPTEPNITALLDPANIKWKDLLSPGIEIPTNWGKDEIEALQAELKANREEMQKAIAEMKDNGDLEEAIEQKKQEFKNKAEQIDQKIDEIRAKYAYLKDKVGAFEGAGYSSKGLYRPMMNCLMFSTREREFEFCKVCQKAIERVIRFYSD